MVWVGDRQIQIIFTLRNQYHAQIFVYVWRHLGASYVHIRNRACNLWRPAAHYGKPWILGPIPKFYGPCPCNFFGVTETK